MEHLEKRNETTVNKPVTDNTNKNAQQPQVEEILDEEEEGTTPPLLLKKEETKYYWNYWKRKPDDIWINAKTKLGYGHGHRHKYQKGRSETGRNRT